MSTTSIAENKRTVKNHRNLLAKAATHDVTPFSIQGVVDGWLVTSGASGNDYAVLPVVADDDGKSPGLGCECKWATQGEHYARWARVSACSHVQKVERYLASLNGRRVYTHATLEDAQRQRREVVAASAADGVWYTVRTDMGPAPADLPNLERLAEVTVPEPALVHGDVRSDVDLYPDHDFEGFD